jgi:predicted ATPase
MLQSEEDTSDRVAQDAEACFQQAIEIARRQGARLYELRATVSLARLWAQQDRAMEAKEALTAIYATFTEGFDTTDLMEARALLEGLGCASSSATSAR